ncbi:hypothetical protein NMY22_g18679 [Coprinellus aureogranulatus]|nr:hypothetical protein NMY22_g18679 [Coprinellus aureogranulatus]
MPTCPSVPPEIWLQILHLAIDDPGSSLERLQLGSNDVYHHIWSESRESRGYRESLTTKCAIVSTCRNWRQWMTPLLYEHFSIRNDTQHCKTLKLLRSAIFTRPNSEFSDCIRPSQLITRLDWFRPGTSGSFHAVCRLCTLLPALTTLAISLLPSHDDPLILLSTLRPALKHLVWTHQPTSDAYFVAHEPRALQLCHVVDFLDRHPKLITLSIPFPLYHPSILEDDAAGDWRSKSWPSVRVIVLQHAKQALTIASHLPAEAFPNLRIVNASYTVSQGLQGLRDFLSTNGRSASVLCFAMNSISPRILRYLASPDTSISEVHLLAASPNSHVCRWLNSKSPPKAHQVKTIGLHPVGRLLDPWSEMSTLQRLAVIPWTNVFPNLTTIRLMEVVDPLAYKSSMDITRKFLISASGHAKHPIHVADIAGRRLELFQFSSEISTRFDPSTFWFGK